MKTGTLDRDGSTLRLAGEVNSNTTAELYRRLHSELAALAPQPGQALIMDCSAVDSCDSAAVALLLAARRMVAIRNGSLHITGISSQVASLAHLYEVDGLLALSPEPHQ